MYWGLPSRVNCVVRPVFDFLHKGTKEGRGLHAPRTYQQVKYNELWITIGLLNYKDFHIGYICQLNLDAHVCIS